MTNNPTPTLLDRVYTALELDRGLLLPAARGPADGDGPDAWRDHGDWLLLAGRLGAERIFFVGDDPVLVFSRLAADADEPEILRVYRGAWSMARPRCLFVELGTELRVYNLDTPPPRSGDVSGELKPIEVVERAAQVQSALGRFHRDRFESGAAFDDPALGPSTGRADRRLLRDVQLATDALQDGGLPPTHAHALIERAILVRYLEDRGVLTDRYFDDVAATTLRRLPPPSDGDPPDLGRRSRFVDFLADRQLTQALFERLADDFNGDLFVFNEDETSMVSTSHLLLLRDLLRGTVGDVQEPLFLWAYDFSVVPTSLVSTMYELFYNEEVGGDTSSTYYTPPELVEFVVADVLSPEQLERAPMICDPACGSGIFLVEAYRRIVRYESAKAGKRLSSASLRKLLVERVAGCDVDRAAVRLAAFSLYVAFLNYQTPQDIQQAGPLPRLIQRSEARKHGPDAPLTVADAFSPFAHATAEGDAPEASRTLPWEPRSFDVVLGNPPWTEPKGGSTSTAEVWAKERELPVGDRSPSQLFLWRVLDLLAPAGVAAMLVSAKVLFNTRSTSRLFRQRWLAHVELERVINFSEVRRDFFERAVAPFVLLRFRHAGEAEPKPFVYETARAVAPGRRGSVALARLDRRLVHQASLIAHDFLWKTYSAGDHRDHALVARLAFESRLRDLRPDTPKAQYGYQRATTRDRDGHPTPASWAALDSLRTFESWGPIREEWLEPTPAFVKFDPSPALFLERALVVRRGVSPGFGPHARLLEEPLAFRHHIYGLPLGHRTVWEAKVALGTVLSSLGRYWLFMVSGAWGTWKDEIRSEQLLDLPLRLDETHPATERIVVAVDRLQDTDSKAFQLDAEPVAPPLKDVLLELDEAVLDLFDLTPAERDLVRDFWAARGRQASAPISFGSPGDEGQGVIHAYADLFRRVWRPLLQDSATLDVRFGQDPQARVVAAVFETHDPRKPATTELVDDLNWTVVLDRYAAALDERTANRLLSYGELRAVTDSAIIIVKRNERRLWSPSAARKDAEASAAQVLALQRS